LFTSEKAPYEIVVKQWKADLVGAQATLKFAEADLARKRNCSLRRSLPKPKSILPKHSNQQLLLKYSKRKLRWSRPSLI